MPAHASLNYVIVRRFVTTTPLVCFRHYFALFEKTALSDSRMAAGGQPTSPLPEIPLRDAADSNVLVTLFH
jgi:hypothetical protein